LVTRLRPLARDGHAERRRPAIVDIVTPSPRPRWALAFPVAGLVAIAIGVAADLRWFDAAVFAGYDKPLHFALYGGCAFFAVGWFHRRPAAKIVAIVTTVVLLEELSQGLFGHRSVDAIDALASTLGILVGGALAAWLRSPTLAARCEPASPP
jgi:hypothetical protein